MKSFQFFMEPGKLSSNFNLAYCPYHQVGKLSFSKIFGMAQSSLKLKAA